MMSITSPTLSVNVQLTRGTFALNTAFACDQRVTGLLGRSGSGKSTLLHLIAGLLRPDSGSISFGDTTWCDHASRTWVPPHERRVGIVFQDARLLPHMTVERNLRYGIACDASRNASATSLDDIVSLMELPGLLGQKPNQLSGGEAQRVAIGRALLSSPRLLLLDEPMAGLDRRLRDQISPLLRRVCQQLAMPILYVSHDLTDVLQLTSSAVLVDAGRVVGCGAINRLVADQHAFETMHDLGIVNVVRCTRRQAVDVGGLIGLEVIPAGPASACDETALLHVSPGTLDESRMGGEVHLAIRPQDIALARHRLSGTSIQNQLRATVSSVHMHDRSMIIEAHCGQTLLVEVSQRAMHELEISPGADIWLLIKANALRVV